MKSIADIILYDRQGEKIGTLYPRRAKQLLLKGRAEWLEEDRSLQLVGSSENKKEETPMEAVYTPNAPTETPRPETDPSLMHQAQENVKFKRRLKRQVLFCGAAWLMMMFFFAGIPFNLPHPRQAAMDGHIAQLRIMHFELRNSTGVRTAGWYNRSNIAMYAIEDYFSRHQVPPLWYAGLGLLTAWSIMIALDAKRLVKISVIPFKTIRVKPDPVMREYLRLKAITEEEARECLRMKAITEDA